MSKNKKLHKANKAKNDEFYTQYNDIQKELNAYIEYDENTFRDKVILLPCDDPEWSNFTKFFAQNFEMYGIKKLISTSYAASSNNSGEYYQVSLFEQESPKYDESKTKTHGKMFVLDRDKNKSGRIDIEDLDFEYLEGDGDFRSEEVKKLRDEADIIITNPPFSLFREFMAWIMEAEKDFLVIGNINCITYKEIFPLIKNNKAWLGTGMGRWISGFIVPDGYELYGTEARIDKDGKRIVSTNNCLWLTNLDHGRRHQPLQLMTMKDNIMYNKKLKGEEYQKYDNYDAIEIPYTDAIPSDYSGQMGVPITFLDKYNPEQFEIVALGNSRENFKPNKNYINAKKVLKDGSVQNGNAINCVLAINSKEKPKSVYYISDNSDYLIAPYARILIKWKKDAPGYEGE